MSLKILTFGWDYPPMRNGGLGVACYGLTRELISKGVTITYVLPRKQPTSGPGRFLFGEEVEKTGAISIKVIESDLQPYHSAHSPVYTFSADGTLSLGKRSMLQAIHDFAEQAKEIALKEDFDIIHAHDWSSYLAGVYAKRVSGKPLILHVHATAYDQAASENIDPAMFEIEKTGFAFADKIVPVSNFTARILEKRYHVPNQKIEVIHNGCDIEEPPKYNPGLQELRAQGKRFVLYHGRITIQKGVDYFVHAAKRVIDIDDSVVFIISGWGDMQEQIIHQVGEMGLTKHVLFAGALWEEERDRMFQSVDLVVMPSVSEPFGLVPLEAMQHGAPSLISKQSGVGEVISHVLKVDFWDIDEMANKILATLKYETLQKQLVKEGQEEMKKLSWSAVAEKVHNLYRSLLQLITP